MWQITNSVALRVLRATVEVDVLRIEPRAVYRAVMFNREVSDHLLDMAAVEAPQGSLLAVQYRH